jgi:hypothetical protein
MAGTYSVTNASAPGLALTRGCICSRGCTCPRGCTSPLYLGLVRGPCARRLEQLDAVVGLSLGREVHRPPSVLRWARTYSYTSSDTCSVVQGRTSGHCRVGRSRRSGRGCESEVLGCPRLPTSCRIAGHLDLPRATAQERATRQAMHDTWTVAAMRRLTPTHKPGAPVPRPSKSRQRLLKGPGAGCHNTTVPARSAH